MRTQRGVSLIELMVSITIGMFLLLGLGTIFVSLNQTSQLKQGLSALQNNERMAMMFMAASIYNAGYYPNPLSGVPPASPLTGFGSATAGMDTLTVSFVAASGVSANQGCTAPLNAGDSYTDTFSVTGGNLNCAETDNGGAPTNYTLITGLSGMNVLYGVDPTCTGSVTEYLSANQAALAMPWPAGVCTPPLGSQIKTVNVNLIFANPLASQASQPGTISITQTMPYMNGM